MTIKLAGYIRIFLLFFGIHVFSQGEANNWYFGSRAGITFNNGAPEALLDGQLDTFEGCSSISDSSGDLLFYSDGQSVWNRNHQVMPNGSGLFGSSSSTQSGLIVPYPGNPNLYYVFAIDLQAGPIGITYSLVDLSLDNGLGDVTSEKNVLLYAPSTEKITAIKHTNSNDIWVITHRADSNEFYTYLIDDTGINLIPIISAIGYSPANEIDSAGYMKVSPDGTRLAIAYSFSNILELFEFDASTGTISSVIQINSLNPINDGSYIYGVEFSQNSELLYVSSLIDGIYQLDLSVYDAASISASQLLIPPDVTSSTTPPHAGLQLGPDGKIYVAHFDYGYLGVINNPDVQGAGCDYSIDGVFLEGRITFFGLPPFIQSFFSAFINAEDSCVGEPIDFSVNANQTIDSILWDFGDTNTASVDSPSHIYNSPGTFTVSVTVTSGLQVTTNTKTVIVYDRPQLDALTVDLRQCDDDQDGFSGFNLNESITELSNLTSEIITYHETLADAENRNNAIENTTAYVNQAANTDTLWIRVENSAGCYSTAQLNLIVSTTQVPITFTREFVACDDGEATTDGIATFDFSSVSLEILDIFPAGQDLIINYYRSESDALSELNPIIDISNYENIGFPDQQDIFVRVDSALDNDCLGYGPYIRLVVAPQPVANPINDDVACDDISNDGVASFVLSNYDTEVLQNQSPILFEVLYFETEADALNLVNALGDTHLVDTESQTLYARIQNRDHPECFDITSFTLGISYLPTAHTPEDLSVCDNDGNDGITIFSLNAQDTAILNGQSPVDYSITYHLTESDAQSGAQPLELNYTNIQNPQTIFARLENTSNTNCFDITHFDLVVIEQPTLEMATEWSICEDGTLELIGEPGYAAYLWSTGETTQSIVVDAPGVYNLTVANIDNAARCEDSIDITVNLSTIALITNVETSDWTSNENTISIFAEGTGDYEYSIDNITYQDSSIFTGLNAGDYSVYVRDKNGCGVVAQEVYLLSYPRFFTPNGDGRNDYWQLIGSNKERNNRLSIFNRYGKLITTISPNNSGWDGTYNGEKMPSSDYWFVLERQNGRTYTGHFTLKR